MRTLQLAGSSLAFAAAFAAYGCVLDVSGVEPTPSTGGAGPTSSSVGPGSTSTGNVVTTSTGIPCASPDEICDDGIDNNCNGKIDCEDDSCTGAAGYACSPAAPAGWTVVGFKPDAAAQCPTGFENPAKVTTKPTATGSFCSCDCGAAAADICTKGVLSVQFGHFNCMGDQFPFDTAGGCEPIGKAIGFDSGMDDWDDAKATGPGLSNTACTATPSAPPPLAPATEGISCAPSSTGGKGCGSASACLPKTEEGSWCIQQAGDVSCPDTTFTKKKVVYDKSDITDKRTCGSCTCTANATKCINGKFTSFDNAQCSGTGLSFDVGVGCKDLTGDNHTHTHYRYTAEPDVKTCKVASAPALNGDVEAKNPITICCP